MPVFQARARFPSSHHIKQGLSGDIWRLTLWSAIDGMAFASCRDVKPVAGQPQQALAIYQPTEIPFGVLQPSPNVGDSRAYSIVANAGEIFLYRDAEGSGMRVEDGSGRLLAMVMGTEPRFMRVGPQVDAGLMTLALLGIDLL